MSESPHTPSAPDAFIIDPDQAAPATVADLLAQSRAAHLEYRRRDAQRIHPGASVSDALRLRLLAHDLDPDHTDPSWAEHKVTHNQLIQFYQHALVR